LQKGEKKPPKKDQKNKPAIFSDWSHKFKVGIQQKQNKRARKSETIEIFLYRKFVN
jgi:hypothetical protein